MTMLLAAPALLLIAVVLCSEQMVNAGFRVVDPVVVPVVVDQLASVHIVCYKRHSLDYGLDYHLKLLRVVEP